MYNDKGITILNYNDLHTYLRNNQAKRHIAHIQLHHTYSPDQSDKKDFAAQCIAMKRYHMTTRKFSDIAQHFTISPHGEVAIGRNINKDPAGIKGHNAHGICIECIGNFDEEAMPEAQAAAVIEICERLCYIYNLDPFYSIFYHCWFDAAGRLLGDYHKGKSCKSCPGKNFFGGNTRVAFENNLYPKIIERRKRGLYMTYGEFTQNMDQYDKDVANKKTPSVWAQESWKKINVGAELLDGSRPHSAVTREELAVVLDRLLTRYLDDKYHGDCVRGLGK